MASEEIGDLSAATALTGSEIVHVVQGGESVRTTTAAISGLALTSRPQKIINGDFRAWQRGTSHTTDGYGSADRWRNERSGGTVTMSRQAFGLGDTLGSVLAPYFLRLDVSGQSAAGDYARAGHRIEGVRSFAGQTVTVLGWARRSSGTGDMALEIEQNFGTGGSPSTSVQVAASGVTTLTSSLVAFAVTFAVPSISGKVLGSNGDDSLALNVWASAGSNFNSRSNSLGTQTIAVDLFGLHILPGTVPVSAANWYQLPDPTKEMARCQRFYSRTEAHIRFSASGSGEYAEAPIYFPQQLRASAIVANTAGARSNVSAVALYSPSDTACRFNVQSTATGDTYAVSEAITASAEL